MNMTSPNRMLPALLIGTALQLLMVIAGHYNAFVKESLFAAAGMAISLLAGVLVALDRSHSIGRAAMNGGAVGGACALIGIAVSVLWGDVPAEVLAFGTVGSALAGVIGGAATRAVGGSRRQSAV